MQDNTFTMIENIAHLMVFENYKKVSLLRAKRATFSFLVDKSSVKMAKMVHFDKF